MVFNELSFEYNNLERRKAMKGRMSTNFWAKRKNSSISRVAQTFMQPSKSTKVVKSTATSSCSGSGCSCSCNGCSACSAD